MLHLIKHCFDELHQLTDRELNYSDDILTFQALFGNICCKIAVGLLVAKFLQYALLVDDFTLYCKMRTQSCNRRKLDVSFQIGLTYTY